MVACLSGIEPATFIEIRGNDRHSWLHNFCTADIRGLSPGKGCEAFVLNVKGRTLAHAIVLAHETSLMLIALGRPESSLIEHFDRYIIREQVTLHDRTNELAVWWMSDLPAEARQLPDNIETWDHMEETSAGCVVAANITADRDWLVVGCGSPFGLSLEANPDAAGAVEFERRRMQRAWPVNGAEVTTARFPQEFLRDAQAVSFTKGCYLGQETVARIDALGHVNWTIARFRGDDGFDLSAVEHPAPIPFDLFEAGDEKRVVGHITSLVPASDGAHMLGFLRKSNVRAEAVFSSAAGAVRLMDEGT